jgi:ATP-binding cassette subfamily G (WHITE) protein 1
LIIKSKFIQAIIIALIVGVIFLNSGSATGTASTQNRSGVLFFAAVNNVMSSCISILSIFGAEKGVFTREHGAGYYSLPAYFFSKTLVEVPYQVIFPFMQATVIYWMVGLQAVASNYLIFCCFVILASITGWAMGVFFACIFPSLPIALAATPVILMPLMLFSGLFANTSSIPVWLRWIQWVSPMKYAYEGMLKNEYYGILLYCNGTVPVDGAYCIATQGLDDGLDVWACAVILIAMMIAFLAVAFNSLNNLVSSKKSMAVHKGAPKERGLFKQRSSHH